MSDLPEYVQPHLKDLFEREAALGNTDPPVEVLEHLAWRRWAKTLSNDALADFLLLVRHEIVQPGDNPLSVKLEEAFHRLRGIQKPKNGTRRACPSKA